jgi:uncharacterized protein YbjQ (UPF0145 family)
MNDPQDFGGPRTPRGSLAEHLIASHVDLLGGEGHTRNPEVSRLPGRADAKGPSMTSTNFSADEWLLVGNAGYEPCGLLAGVAVFHIGLVGVLTGNKEVLPLSGALLDAREIATRKLEAQAKRSGADGVVGVRLSIEMLDSKSHLARFIAIGSGIRRKRGVTSSVEPAVVPFLSALSGQEFAILVIGGYLPVGMVMGVCVFHIARMRPASWFGTTFRSVELPGYTNALYEARELAMTRLQKEAELVDADGVVGVQVTERPHVWGSRVIEFFVIGTAIKAVSEEHGGLHPKFVLSLHDDAIVTDPGAILGSHNEKVQPS